jgi:hypothetical protein
VNEPSPRVGADDAALPVSAQVLRGAPTEAELAAVIAVVTEAYEREAAAAVVDESPRRSTWDITARSLRRPLPRDLTWGRFSG